MAYIRYHSALANYFSAQVLFFDGDLQKKPHIRKCMEQPFQQTKAQLWDEVTETLCNLDFIQAKAVAKMNYDLVRDFNEVLEVIPDNAENILKENERQARLDKYSLDLVLYAKAEIIKLKVPESIKPWPQEKIDSEIKRMKNNPSRLDRLNDFKKFLGKEGYNLQIYAWLIPHFATQQAWNYVDSGPVGKMAEEELHNKQGGLLLRLQTTRPTWNPLPQSLRTLLGHKDCVNSVSITLDGKFALSGSKDCTLILWNLFTGEKIKTIKEPHIEKSTKACISTDGKFAIFSSYRILVKCNLETGEVLKEFKGHSGSIKALIMTSDGKHALSGSSDRTIILWDLESGEKLKTFSEHSQRINDLSISPDGNFFVSCSFDKTIIYWDLISGGALKILKGHSRSVNAVSMTPDNRLVISGSDDTTLILWDLKNGTELKTLIGHLQPVDAVCISPDGNYAISGSVDRTLIHWDLTSGKALNIFFGHTGWITTVKITGDGKMALSSSGDRTLILWDLIGSIKRDGLMKNHDLVGPTDPICITPDNKYALTGRTDYFSRIYEHFNIMLWDIENGQPLKKLTPRHGSKINMVSVTPDGKKVISSSKERPLLNLEKTPDLKIFDLKSGLLLDTLHQESGWDKNWKITPDSKRVLVAYNKDIIIWDIESGQILNTLSEHSNSINTFCVTLDGKYAISGSDDMNLIFWDLANNKVLKTLRGHTWSVSASNLTPDGKLAISVSNSSLILWDLEKGQAIRRLDINARNPSSLCVTPDGRYAVSIMGDGRYLVSINDDGSNVIMNEDYSLILWNLSSGKVLTIFKGHHDSIIFFIISLDGKRIFSISKDRTLIIWDLESGNMKSLYAANFSLTAFSIFSQGVFITSESEETLLFHLKRDLLCPGPAVLTIRSIWDFSTKKYLPLSSTCPFCGHNFAPERNLVKRIQTILRINNINPVDSPCLKLPKKAWDDPGLLSGCPKCGAELKFNPFIAGGD